VIGAATRKIANLRQRRQRQRDHECDEQQDLHAAGDKPEGRDDDGRGGRRYAPVPEVRPVSGKKDSIAAAVTLAL
jgi:hypothetical protein